MAGSEVELEEKCSEVDDLELPVQNLNKGIGIGNVEFFAWNRQLLRCWPTFRTLGRRIDQAQYAQPSTLGVRGDADAEKDGRRCRVNLVLTADQWNNMFHQASRATVPGKCLVNGKQEVDLRRSAS